MTVLQKQAFKLIRQLPADKLDEVVEFLTRLQPEQPSGEEKASLDEVSRRQRLAAWEGLQKAREELIGMNIDWRQELAEALAEKYGMR